MIRIYSNLSGYTSKIAAINFGGAPAKFINFPKSPQKVTQNRSIAGDSEYIFGPSTLFLYWIEMKDRRIEARYI